MVLMVPELLNKQISNQITMNTIITNVLVLGMLMDCDMDFFSDDTDNR